ncbi:DUF3299 domain-containing protein [Alteromonas pelagimontana]|uniref:DUF3299 domain-containing protein n=1 Tax=Alteromonas pelagimontana TaxID=1858656 RepID=A0A6M4MF13_9ALTE|nr:DUF3299 domain-containing protein [Alteromonas pelagimontana]QJR81230.1 DUF3299 domain-containing protein [Alteromonas pelagimontana]
MQRLTLQHIIFLALSLAFAFSAKAEEPQEVYWEDLIPEGFNELDAPAIAHDGKMTQLQPNAPVVDKYDGQYVKVPGFVVPLEGDEKLTTEFLLVPYFGACIHVPPPPSNQIVHVKFKEGVPIENLYDAIWVTGKLSTDGWAGDIASVGYTMEGVSVAPF